MWKDVFGSLGNSAARALSVLSNWGSLTLSKTSWAGSFRNAAAFWVQVVSKMIT